MANEIEQLAEQHGMTVEFVAWFFSEKKASCGNVWFMMMAASAIEDLLEHTDPNTSYYSGVWADVPGKLRAAMLAAAPQEAK